MKLFLSGILLLCLLAYSSILAYAQETPHKVIKKYNQHFAGIGPKVYFLPAPRTKEEILKAQYIQKKEEQEPLKSLIEKLNLQRQLIVFKTSTISIEVRDILKIVEPDSSQEQKMLSIIAYYKQHNNESIVADWQNNLAVYYLITGEVERSRALFLVALEAKERADEVAGRLSILNNLALLEANYGEQDKALNYYDVLLSQAKDVKNIDHQALAYMAIARLESGLGNFSAAHTLTIEKSFPLLRSTKNYYEVVNALLDLASFKEMADEQTEAKWIYLQAIDVAMTNKDEMGLAKSLFKIAELKTRIGDANLAVADYLQARELAIKNGMDSLLIEIIDGLGDTYLQLNEYTEAVLALNEYNTLKTDFLNVHANM